MFSKLFNLKELPILLTFLFTLLGWTFMRLSDKVTEAPTLEYKLVYNSNSSDTSSFYYRIINLTNNKQFKNVNFKISLPPGSGHIESGKLQEVAPAPSFNTEPIIDKFFQSEITFVIKRFNPHSQYNLIVNYTGKIKSPVFGLSYSEVHEDAIMEPLVLKKASLFTFLIKNDVILYSILFVIFLLLIVLYLLKLSNLKT